eukprot:CAMPEP_0172854064 /NCGR_PEP_ID=MMETSP1075-20121228/57527_1 /TAXON_ID=2916 /ORGANISM="Ceratium fusus, Strain PA161109" /LENGTH=67 /DNA_ID=CAMNT_0013700667 /DNA_START=49 /DNA_END=249 /DNA_ORIENTATION=+
MFNAAHAAKSPLEITTIHTQAGHASNHYSPSFTNLVGRLLMVAAGCPTTPAVAITTAAAFLSTTPLV